MNIGSQRDGAIKANVGAGVALGSLTINSAGNFTADSTITASSVSQLAGTQTQLSGLVTTTGTTNLVASNLDIDGGISANAGISLTGAGSINLSSDLTTVGTNMALNNAVTLDGDVQLSTGNAAGAINFANSLNGNQVLTLTAGTGGITFSTQLAMPRLLLA